MVLEAVQPVGVVSLAKFKERGKPGAFLARRLRLPLTPENTAVPGFGRRRRLGKTTMSVSCGTTGSSTAQSLVWKIYNQAGVELCEPRRVGSATTT